MQPSSSRRETTPEYCRNPTIGCLSGLLRLLAPRRHSPKRLPSARKREKTLMAESPAPEKKEEKKELEHTSSPDKKNPLHAPPISLEQKNRSDAASISPEAKSSPDSAPIQPEKKNPPDPAPIVPEKTKPASAAPISPEIRRSPALVARLMGLEDAQPGPREPAEEKRRELLKALEKCDEDLKALKRIIEAVRLAEAVGSRLNGRNSVVETTKCVEICAEQPSPVSVLDAFPSPKFPAKGEHFKKKAEAGRSSMFFQRIALEGLPRESPNCHGDESEVDDMHGRWSTVRRRPTTRSTVVAETVEEVWDACVWEERWEHGRIGIGLEMDILGDIVEELVRELIGCCYKLSVPFRASCTKKLCF